MSKTGFGVTARQLARDVADGIITQSEAERVLDLQPGQHLAPTGVVTGHEQDPEIPRFGADENFGVNG